jgi:DNA polymerase
MERSLHSLIDWYGRVGVDVPDLPPAPTRKRPAQRSAVKTKPAGSTAVKPLARPAPAASTPTLDPAPIAAACKTIAELKAALDQFDAGVLSDGARQAVLSRGTPGSLLMIIGEAPGQNEDRDGQPFVGRSGQLLDRMIGAIGLGRDEVYISNVCFWRPPNNRKPEPSEIELCRPFVTRHIQLAQPKVLLLVGGTALQAMTGVNGIMRNRGQWQRVAISTEAGNSLPALPIYHPAFLLRQPALKADAWRDLLSLREKLSTLSS